MDFQAHVVQVLKNDRINQIQYRTTRRNRKIKIQKICLSPTSASIAASTIQFLEIENLNATKRNTMQNQQQQGHFGLQQRRNTKQRRDMMEEDIEMSNRLKTSDYLMQSLKNSTTPALVNSSNRTSMLPPAPPFSTTAAAAALLLLLLQQQQPE